MTITFATPSSGSGDNLKAADVHGHTLIVFPTEHVTGITTIYGESDAIKINVHDLTAAADGTDGTYHDVLWFSGYLVGAFKGRIGQHLLVRIEQGTPKAGQSPPWIAVDAQDNPAAVAAAQEWLAANPGVLEGAPVPSFAAPATEAPAAPAPRPF